MISNIELQQALQMLPVYRQHPSFPIMNTVRPIFQKIYEEMTAAKLPDDTLVEEWIKRRMRHSS